VIISIAILFGGVIALSQLASIGHQHSRRSARITTAQTLCQNKLNEVVTGVIPLMPVVDAPCHESPDWTYTISSESMTNGLVSVKVSVYQTTENRLTGPDGTIEAVTLRNKPHYSLVRWLRPIQNENAESFDENTLTNDEDMARLTP
jgi:hypothetical protein